MKDEIKALEAPAIAYTNTSMVRRIHDCFTCKDDKESRNRQTKDALVLLLLEKSESLQQV